MVHVVLDTNVLVAALRSDRGASFLLLSMVGPEAPFRPVISVPLVFEYEMALKRVGDVSEEDVERVVDYLCAVGDRREIFFLWRPFLNDPKDELVLEVAVSGQARAIVTHNVRDFEGVKVNFGIEVLTPAEFLLALKEKDRWAR